jgi:hypothetical protein
MRLRGTVVESGTLEQFRQIHIAWFANLGIRIAQSQ